MAKKWIRYVGTGVVAALWLVLTGFAWFGQRQEASTAERRALAQAPALQAEAVLDGSFMEEFESFSLDQFPLRDSFRQLKALFQYDVLFQSDNNGIYIAQGSAAQQVYPLNQASVDYAVGRFTAVYETYLQDAAGVYVAVVPDKGYYLASDAGQPRMDYEALFETVRTGMPWAKYIDLTDTLQAGDYYRTDTHWRQERLCGAASAICEAMGVTAPKLSDYRVRQVDAPFYGVYYGQAALPMEPDTLQVLESQLLDGCVVTYHDYTALGSKVGGVYDWDKLESADLYQVFLAGSRSLITIENPGAKTDRELVVFRDSFGSAITPLLLADYAKVTLIDIRYIQAAVAANFVSYEGADVLFLYSTLVLNESASIRP